MGGHNVESVPTFDCLAARFPEMGDSDIHTTFVLQRMNRAFGMWYLTWHVPNCLSS
jgi:hypothetical protein